MHKLKILAFIIIFSLIPGILGANNTLKIAFPEFYPFFVMDNKGDVKGFFYDIVSEAAKRMDTETTWSQMPWKRCQFLVETGKFDAMITVPTKDRMSYCKTHKDPFFIKSRKLFTFRDNPEIEKIKRVRSIADIKKFGFSVITYSGNGWNEKNIKSIGIKTLETSKVQYIWNMLAAKRGDLVIEWPLAAYESIKKANVGSSILEIDISLESLPFHLLISNRSDTSFSLERFNRIIKGMKEDRTIEKILSSYY